MFAKDFVVFSLDAWIKFLQQYIVLKCTKRDLKFVALNIHEINSYNIKCYSCFYSVGSFKFVLLVELPGDVGDYRRTHSSKFHT